MSVGAGGLGGHVVWADCGGWGVSARTSTVVFVLGDDAAEGGEVARVNTGNLRFFII